MKYFSYTAAFLVLLFLIIVQADHIIPASNFHSAPYADWAHKHWIWHHNNVLNQSSLLQLYEDYTSRDIPVGTVLVDSEWSVGINNFIWNRVKFPDHKSFIQFFHRKNVTVICWVTSAINLNSPNYKEGFEKNYYLNNGTSIRWWRGIGSFLDYTNPEAVEWWHKQLDKEVLVDGVDGWKVDGIDPHLLQMIYLRGRGGIIPFRTYSELYYRDFLYYTRKVRGPQALIMARPYERWGLVNYKFAPRDVVFAGWVGDQDPTFEGMKVALIGMFQSAWDDDKYVNFGSDIGGYRAGPGPLGRTKQLFVRWTQMSAFNSLMENGGGGEHRPWMFDDETLQIYRHFVHIHHELIPYMLTAGTLAFERNISVMVPFAKYTPIYPSRWDFMFGKDIYVFPMVENVTKVTITFPEGNNWIDWWNGHLYQGGSTVSNYDVPLRQFPVFKRQGAIFPLEVSSPICGNGDSTSAGYLTLLIQNPLENHEESIEVREFNGGGCSVDYQYDEKKETFTVKRTAHRKPVIIVIRGLSLQLRYKKVIVIDVMQDSIPIKEYKTFMNLSHKVNREIDGGISGYSQSLEKNEIWIKMTDATKGVHLMIRPDPVKLQIN